MTDQETANKINRQIRSHNKKPDESASQYEFIKE